MKQRTDELFDRGSQSERLVLWQVEEKCGDVGRGE